MRICKEKKKNKKISSKVCIRLIVSTKQNIKLKTKVTKYNKIIFVIKSNTIFLFFFANIFLLLNKIL